MTSSAGVTAMSGRNNRRRDECISKNTGATLSEVPDDSLNLVAFLEDQKKGESPLSEIFTKIGLDKQNWNFRQTVGYLEFTHSNGVEMDFHFAIDMVTDLAAILLECSVSGGVDLPRPGRV